MSAASIDGHTCFVNLLLKSRNFSVRSQSTFCHIPYQSHLFNTQIPFVKAIEDDPFEPWRRSETDRVVWDSTGILS